MTRTAINLYSVRDLDEPTTATLDRVADAGYDGVQFSGGVEEDAVEIRRTLVEHNLDVTPAHVGVDTLETEFEETLSFYDELGCGGVVVPWLPPADFADESTLSETVDRIAGLAKRVRAAGFSFHYHNHDQEFQPVGPSTGYDHLLAETDICIELDVGWAAAAGRDPVALLEAIGERGPLVHLKDVEVETGTPVEIGTGDVDMQACADAAREAGAVWLIYEHDHPADPVASIEHGARFLASL